MITDVVVHVQASLFDLQPQLCAGATWLSKSCKAQNKHLTCSAADRVCHHGVLHRLACWHHCLRHPRTVETENHCIRSYRHRFLPSRDTKDLAPEATGGSVAALSNTSPSMHCQKLHGRYVSTCSTAAGRCSASLAKHQQHSLHKQ